MGRLENPRSWGRHALACESAILREFLANRHHYLTHPFPLNPLLRPLSHPHQHNFIDNTPRLLTCAFAPTSTYVTAPVAAVAAAVFTAIAPMPVATLLTTPAAPWLPAVEADCSRASPPWRATAQTLENSQNTDVKVLCSIYI